MYIIYLEQLGIEGTRRSSEISPERTFLIL